MSPDEFSGPDLDGVVTDANAVGLNFVVIGGFSVIANGYLRATDDSDLLVPDGPETDAAIARFLDLTEATRLYDGKELATEDITGAEQLRVKTRHGIVDILRGGIVGFKRLAGRPRDRNDLEELEAFHGELPIDPIPGIDS